MSGASSSGTIDPMALFRTVAAAALLVAACSSPTVTPRTTDGAATPTPVPGTTSAPTPPLLTDSPIATLVSGQVDTEWGPIWETLPDGFPVIAGAEPAEADAVVSAAWTVPASGTVNARGIVNEYARRFSGIGYGGTVDGPFEDGSYTAWASNGYGCDILVTTVPRGGAEVYVTVMYGAVCPFEWVGTSG